MPRRKKVGLDAAHNEKAEAVFAIYRDLGFQRPSLAKFAPWLLQEHAALATPLDTLKYWSARHRWQDRLMTFDDECQRQSELAHLRWVRQQTVSRSAQRFQSATLLREVGLRGLTDADGHAIDPRATQLDPKTGKERKVEYPEPAYLSQWRRLLVDAANLERLELGLPTQRLDQMGTAAAGAGIGVQVNVLGADALAELRKLVQQLPDQAGHPTIIEGEHA